MWLQMKATLESFFIYPVLDWDMMLVAVGLAVAFGAIWLLLHWPPLFNNRWLWAVGVFSAFFTVLAIVFVQVPLQHWVGQVLTHFWDQVTLFDWLLLAGIPTLLLSGLVQEGAKMVPIVFWWWRSEKSLTPRMGLAIGAIAGAGFGIFEAFWIHGRLFMSGWTVDAIANDGFLGIAGFWERFFVLGFHIAASALAGYGLAKGKGWQFYLIASGLHLLLNYGVVFYQKGYFSLVQTETWVAGIAVLVATTVLMIRWQRDLDEEEDAGEPVESAEPVNNEV
ncbi:MAG: hypothetical protein PVG61_05790 [Dehalococcoidia bacterium]|jgi:RsiW-degrading membrane proteinase PrsW (M82 family)